MKFKKFTIFAVFLLLVALTAHSVLADELQIIDISNPTSPKGVGFSAVAGPELKTIAVSGDYAYVGGANLEIYDISDPEKPDRLSGVALGNRARDIEVSGTYAYVATTQSLEVYDVSNLENPILVGKANTDNGPNDNPRDIIVSGNYLYMGTNEVSGNANVEIFNILDPSDPIRVGTADVAEHVPGVAVADGHLYVVIDNDNQKNDGIDPPDIYVFDISDPANPTEVATVNYYNQEPGIHTYYNFGLNTIYTAGNYIYVGGDVWDGDEFAVFDISDPSNPVKIGGAGSLNRVNQIIVAGGFAYLLLEPGLLTTFNEVRIFDVSSPTAPKFKAKIPFDAEGFDISGNYAYLVGKSAGLQNICKLFNLTEEEKEKIIQNLEDKQEKIKEKHNEIKDKIQASLEEAIKNGVQSEVEWRAKFKVKIELLKSIAQTDEQKQAVQTFESDVLTARDTFREANNNSRNEFHDGLKDLVDQKQGNIQAAIDTFQTGVENAFNKANSSCEANEEASAILSTFKEDMNAAKEKVKSDMDEVRNNMQPQVDALIQTRQSQVETAKNDFVNAITSAAQELKNSFM